MNSIFLLMKRTLLGKGNKRIIRNIILQSMLFLGVMFLKWPIGITPQVWCTIAFAIGFSSTLLVLLSDTFRGSMENQFMLPYRKATFNTSLLGAMIIYVFNTKFGYVFFLAVSSSFFTLHDGIRMLTTFLLAIMMSIVFYTALIHKRYWISLLLAFSTSCVLFVFYSGISNTIQIMLLVLLLIPMLAAYYKLDIADSFIRISHKSRKLRVRVKNGWLIVPKYCIRHMTGNFYFILNMIGILAFGMFVSYTFYQGKSENLMTGLCFGMALISLNSPLSSVISGDKSLARKLDLLPKQVSTFFLPYGVVVLMSGLVSNSLFLLFWCFVSGDFEILWALHMAINFALQSALTAIVLERYYPYLSWNVENDLWRHPRKYISVAINLLYASVLLFFPPFNIVISGLLVLQFFMLIVLGRSRVRKRAIG